MLAQESGVQAIIGPDDIFDSVHRELSKVFLLLYVVQNDRSSGDEQKTASATKANVHGSVRRLDSLGC